MLFCGNNEADNLILSV